MMLIEKPSQLPLAIGEALHAAFPDLKIGNHQDFSGAGDTTGVLITVEGNAPGATMALSERVNA